MTLTFGGSLSFRVSDRRRQAADAFHVGITACSNIETNNKKKENVCETLWENSIVSVLVP